MKALNELKDSIPFSYDEERFTEEDKRVFMENLIDTLITINKTVLLAFQEQQKMIDLLKKRVDEEEYIG